eukprot:SAG11_NODE_6420_length_1317_cov_10.994253_2_plen_132_part_00
MFITISCETIAVVHDTFLQTLQSKMTEPQPNDGSSSGEEYVNAEDDDTRMISPQEIVPEPEPAVEAEPALAAHGFVFDGVKPQALMRLLEIYPEILEKKLTTSDVCHTILKPMTVPAGWVNKPTATNPKES